MQRGSSAKLLPARVDFFLAPGFSMLALCAAIEPLRLANQLLGERHYTWRLASADGRAVRASCGMMLPCDRAVDPAGDVDLPQCLIVFAGFDPWPQTDRRVKNWIRGLDRRGAILGAVDTGAFLLAAAGVLADTPTAVHWESAGAFAELFPDIPTSPHAFEISERRLLCAGGTAVLDMMVALIGAAHGGSLAVEISGRLLASADVRRDPAGATGASPAADPQIAQVVGLMDERLETPSSIVDLAAAANVSKRTLERMFRRSLNQTPKQVYLQRRLDHARRLLRHTDLPVREVALAAGFTSASYFCRAYKARFRAQPGRDRRLDTTLVERDLALSCEAETANPNRTGIDSTRQRPGASVQRARRSGATLPVQNAVGEPRTRQETA